MNLTRGNRSSLLPYSVLAFISFIPKATKIGLLTVLYKESFKPTKDLTTSKTVPFPCFGYTIALKDLDALTCVAVQVLKCSTA